MTAVRYILIFALALSAACSDGNASGETEPSADVSAEASPPPTEDPDERMYKQCMVMYNNGNPPSLDAYFDCRNEYNAQGGRRSLP